MRTIADFNPYFSYSRFQFQTTEKGIDNLISNLVEDMDPEIKCNYPPRIIMFGDELYIGGSSAEVALGSAFVRDNPGFQYAVDHFSDPELAKREFMAVFGQSYEHYENILPELGAEEEESQQESFFEDIEDEPSDIKARLKFYLSAYPKKREKPNTCPFLRGHSGISKSAIVYESVKELDAETKDLSVPELIESGDWGYKVIEIRAGFIDLSDLMGFTHSVPSLSGGMVMADSPKREFLLCTTGFVEECRDFLRNLKPGDITEENMHFINKMRYYAKTPVLFLDEINRALLKILEQFMVCINKHRLGNYDISVSPIICAGNEIIDMEGVDPEDAEKFRYAVNRKEDLAVFKGRFLPIMDVTGSNRSVVYTTFNFLQDQFKDSKYAKEALKYANDGGLLYNHKLVDDNGKFPTFRGWEDVCKYLAWIEKQPSEVEPIFKIITGLLGDKVNPLDFFKERPLSKSSSTSEFIRHCLDSGVPCTMLGAQGVAKTALAEQYAIDTGAIFEPIDMVKEGRCTISGVPENRKFIETIFRLDVTPKEHRQEGWDLKKDLDSVNSELFKKFEEKTRKNPRVPLETTVALPDPFIDRKVFEIRERMARGEKVKLVLFFDEFNRCDPILQSAIFEAVSLKKYRGLSLDGIDVGIVSAGNWQSKKDIEQRGKIYTTKDVDTATIHRGAVCYIEEVSDKDVKGFMENLKNKHPFAFQMFEKSFKTGELKKMLNYKPVIETSVQDTDIFCFRSVTAIENMALDYDFDLTEGLALESDLHKILGILESPHYILHKVGPKATLDWSEDPSLKKLYVKGDEKVTVSKFVSKTIDLLKDKAIDKETKVRIFTLLRFIEVEKFNPYFESLTSHVPKEMRESIGNIIYKAYSDRTIARATANLTEDNIFGSSEEAERAIIKLVSQFKPDSLDIELEKHLLFLIKESKEKIPLSKIVNAIKIYNSSTAAKQSSLSLPLEEVVSRLTEDKSKIKDDYSEKKEFNLVDIVNGKGKINPSMLKILQDHVIVSNDMGSGEKAEGFTVGYHHIDSNSVVPDLFSFTYKTSEGHFGSVTLDDSTFKVKIVKGTGNVVDYTFSGKISIIDIVIRVSAVNSVPNTANKKKEDQIISDAALKDPDILVHKNLSSLVGAIKSIEVHGSSLEDVPELDKTEIHKLHNTKATVSHKNVANKAANFALVFKRSFSGIERLFS